MDFNQMKACIAADTDQDREAARTWFREATDADKIRVWMAIQKPHTDPVMEIVTRLAQLAFSELILEEPPHAPR